MHRNSQKRFIVSNGVYFVTTVTKDRWPYFLDPHLANLLVKEIRAVVAKGYCTVYGFVIIPDHLHILLRPCEGHTVSQCMFSIKKQFTHEANRMFGWNPPPEGEQTFVHLREILDIRTHVERHRRVHAFTRFAWQHSFHDHIIRDERDFATHMAYIRYNPVKHGVMRNDRTYPFLWIDAIWRDRAGPPIDTSY